MITLEPTTPPAAILDDLTTEDFLQVIGQRVRQQRTRKSMSRKRLAEVSTVSERYLAQLESGQGNMSIALLRKVTSAIGITMESLMCEQVTENCISKVSQTPIEAANQTAIGSRQAAMSLRNESSVGSHQTAPSDRDTRLSANDAAPNGNASSNTGQHGSSVNLAKM